MMESKRLQTAKKYLAQFGANDIELLESILDDAMVHEFSPLRSLDTARNFDKAGFIGFRDMMESGLTGYPMDVKQYIESESSNMVVVWAEGRPQFREELKDYEAFPKEQWEYVGEFVFMLTFNETGDKIIKVREFVDSKGTDNRFLPLATKTLEKLQKILQEAGK